MIITEGTTTFSKISEDGRIESKVVARFDKNGFLIIDIYIIPAKHSRIRVDIRKQVIDSLMYGIEEEEEEEISGDVYLDIARKIASEERY